jgi:glucose-1-phosphate cytidylyltransferase
MVTGHACISLKSMKVVILAGGAGTRLAEETQTRPKPMVEIGGRPILWHIMKLYSHYGFDEFVICLGVKGYMIKEYFANYALHNSDVTFDFRGDTTTVHQRQCERWSVTLVDTGVESMTGGRLKRVARYLDGGPFCLTYGDGVADVDVANTVRVHQEHGKLATITAVQPPGRFGALRLDGEFVSGFQEKPDGDGAWINGGFFVFEPGVLDRIKDDTTVLEQYPLQSLAEDSQLVAVKHTGFWQPMDTLREKNQLEALWQSGRAPWRVWH